MEATITPEIEADEVLPLRTIDPIKEAEWEGFIRTLHIWEMRRLCALDPALGHSREMGWHDKFVTGKMDLIEVYAEIAEPQDYEVARQAYEDSIKPTNPVAS